MNRILPLLLGLALLAGCKGQTDPAQKAPIGDEDPWYKGIVDMNPAVNHVEKVPTPYPPSAIEDLPAPVEFDIVPRESFAYVHLATRVAKLRYRGLAPIADIEKFYTDTMPNIGWKQKFVLGHDRPNLVFEKATETCEVVIKDVDKYREITLTLEPK